MSKEPLSCEYVSSLLSYDPEAGILRWRVARNNRVKVGQEAGSVSSNEYLHIGIDGRQYLAHRLAWLHVHGEWPNGQIDHINRVKTDNRLSNLRACSPRENSRNRKIRCDNKSGVPGIHWSNKKNAWGTSVAVAGRQVSAGYFNDLGSAEQAIKQLREARIAVAR